MITNSLERNRLFPLLEKYVADLGFNDLSQIPMDSSSISLATKDGKDILLEVCDDGILISTTEIIEPYRLSEILEPAMQLCHYSSNLPIQPLVGLGKGGEIVFSALINGSDCTLDKIVLAVKTLLGLHESLAFRKHF